MIKPHNATLDNWDGFQDRPFKIDCGGAREVVLYFYQSIEQQVIKLYLTGTMEGEPILLQLPSTQRPWTPISLFEPAGFETLTVIVAAGDTVLTQWFMLSGLSKAESW
jgi:hypothetical protein